MEASSRRLCAMAERTTHPATSLVLRAVRTNVVRPRIDIIDALVIMIFMTISNCLSFKKNFFCLCVF